MVQSHLKYNNLGAHGGTNFDSGNIFLLCSSSQFQAHCKLNVFKAQGKINKDTCVDYLWARPMLLIYMYVCKYVPLCIFFGKSYYAQTVGDPVCRPKIGYVRNIWEVLNLKGYQNHMIDSKGTAILWPFTKVEGPICNESSVVS